MLAFGILFALALLCFVWGDEQNGQTNLPAPAYQPFYQEWTELIELSGMRGDELVLYRLNGYITSNYVESLEEPYRLPLNFGVLFDLLSGTYDTLASFDSIQAYLRALRINFSSWFEYSDLWKLFGGYIEIDYIASMSSEIRALKLLALRLEDLRTMDATDERAEFQDILFSKFSYGFANASAWLSDFSTVNSEQFCLLEGSERQEYLDTAFAGLLAKILTYENDPVALGDLIEKNLLEPVLGHYFQYSLSPFLLTRWCHHIAHTASLNRYQIIGNASITFPGSDSIDGLYTIRRVLTHANWSFIQDTQLTERFLELNQNFFLHSETKCEIESRQMLITDGWNDTRMHEMQNPYGGGCLSTRELLCCSHTSDLVCIPVGQLINSHYNSMILGGALALVTPPRSGSKVLSIGLGGGELHSGLLAYFEGMDVYSVDISSEIVHMAWEQFGMKHLVCGVHFLEEGEFYPYTSLHVSALIGRSKYTHAHLKKQECQSHLVIADVWELIDALFNAKMSKTTTLPMPVQYDVIVFDAFDASASRWSPHAFEGESNIRSGYAILSINKLRKLLTEDGSAVFHIHKDKNFLSYVELLKGVFGDKNVVVLDISSLDSIIVATNSIFFPHLHEYVPRTELHQCDTVDINFDSVQQCNYIATHSGGEVEEDFVHPCEHPETFYRNVHKVVDALDLPRKLRYASFHALNCTGYVSESPLSV